MNPYELSNPLFQCVGKLAQSEALFTKSGIDERELQGRTCLLLPKARDLSHYSQSIVPPAHARIAIAKFGQRIRRLIRNSGRVFKVRQRDAGLILFQKDAT